jgi:hypothetical protein
MHANAVTPPAEVTRAVVAVAQHGRRDGLTLPMNGFRNAALSSALTCPCEAAIITASPQEVHVLLVVPPIDRRSTMSQRTTPAQGRRSTIGATSRGQKGGPDRIGIPSTYGSISPNTKSSWR